MRRPAAARRRLAGLGLALAALAGPAASAVASVQDSAPVAPEPEVVAPKPKSAPPIPEPAVAPANPSLRSAAPQTPGAHPAPDPEKLRAWLLAHPNAPAGAAPPAREPTVLAAPNRAVMPVAARNARAGAAPPLAEPKVIAPAVKPPKAPAPGPQ